ncbi:hypothetical protein OHR68_19675 [Spirillospora sp. NBC_00431]
MAILRSRPLRRRGHRRKRRSSNTAARRSHRTHSCRPRRRLHGWILARGLVIDGFRPDRWDLTGALICLIGVAVIM